MQSRLLGIVVIAVSFSVGGRAHASGASKPKDDTPPPPKPRVLKKLVQIDHIGAKPILQNGQVVFDLEDAINLQAVTAAIKNGKFTVKTSDANTMTMGSNGVATTASSSMSGMVLSDNEKCLASLPAFRIGGNVLSFELESTNGISLGFSPKIDFDIGAGLNFTVGTSRLNATFTASDRSATRTFYSVTTNEKQEEKKGGFNLSFLDMFNLGFDNYSKTPLAQVVSTSLSKAMNGIAAATAGLVWEAPIIIADRNLVALNAGFDAGIVVGDQFKIQNAEHYWSGLPCQSDYLGMRPDPDPVAIVEVYDVQGTLSWAKVVQSFNSDISIEAGARAQVSKLMPATK